MTEIYKVFIVMHVT